MKVEIITTDSNYKLQRDINEWLRLNEFEIVDIKFSGRTLSNFESTASSCAMIIYKTNKKEGK